MPNMRYNRLGNTDMHVSHIGLGGAAFSGIYGPYEESVCVQLVRDMFRLGINYLETGPWYGQGSSERIIGTALKDVPRSAYFIASKVGRYEKDYARMFDFSAEKTEAGVNQTLERLGLEYVDLIQVHDLSFAPSKTVILQETLPVLAQAVADGKAKYIGLADYDLDLLKEIVEESTVPIATILSYAKSTLLDNRLQNYTSFFKARGVGVINAAPTGMGLLCNQGPQSWHPANDEIKTLCRAAAVYCEEKQVELAQLATWFSITQPDIATTICGFRTFAEMKSAVKLFTNGLSALERKALCTLRRRYFDHIPRHWDNVEVVKYKSRIENIENAE